MTNANIIYLGVAALTKYILNNGFYNKIYRVMSSQWLIVYKVSYI